MINYNRVHSLHTFIEIMKRLTDEEKFAFLYDYFYKNVDYNYYEWLFGEFSGVDYYEAEYIDYKGELNPNGGHMKLCELTNVTYFNTKDIQRKNKLLFQEIIKIRDSIDFNSAASIEEYKERVIKLFNNEFFDNIESEEIREKLFTIFKEKILDRSLVPLPFENYKVLYDITWMAFKSFEEDYSSGKGTYYNGLIRKGVCRHFSAFIKEVLDELGVHNVEITGISESLHAWNMVLINGEIRFIDITKEIHLRNGAMKGFNKGDFYLISIEELFKLEPDRDIRKLDGKKLDTIITKNNYFEHMDELYSALRETEYDNKETKRL